MKKVFVLIRRGGPVSNPSIMDIMEVFEKLDDARAEKLLCDKYDKSGSQYIIKEFGVS